MLSPLPLFFAIGLAQEASSPATPEVERWLRENAKQLKLGAAEGISSEGAIGLGESAAEARLVLLGEATHGTKEFTRLRWEITDHLIRKGGFSFLAIEASWPDALAVNEYVMGGRGSAEEVVDKLGFWILDNAEMIEVVEALRRHNIKIPPERRVGFVGFDMQMTRTSAEALSAFLAKADPVLLKESEVALSFFLHENYQDDSYAKTAEFLRKAAAAQLQKIDQQIKAKKEAFLSKASEAEVSLAARHAELLLQAEAYYAEPDFVQRAHFRERCMAQNILSQMKQGDAQSRWIVWAHNGHVARGWLGGVATPMGAMLREDLGAKAFSVAMTFGQGSFRAANLETNGELATFELGPPSAGHFEEAFSRIGGEAIYWDLGTLPRDGPVADWFSSPHWLRNIGAGFRPHAEQVYRQSVVLPALFDGVLFTRLSTPSEPNSAGMSDSMRRSIWEIVLVYGLLGLLLLIAWLEVRKARASKRGREPESDLQG